MKHVEVGGGLLDKHLVQLDLLAGDSLITKADAAKALVLKAAADPGLHHAPGQLLALLLRLVEVLVEVESCDDSQSRESLLDLQQVRWQLPALGVSFLLTGQNILCNKRLKKANKGGKPSKQKVCPTPSTKGFLDPISYGP